MFARQRFSYATGLGGLAIAFKATCGFIASLTQLTMQANNPMNGISVQVPQFQSQPVNVFEKAPALWRNDSTVDMENVADFSTHFQQPFEHNSKLESTTFPEFSCPQCPKCPPHICPECPILNRSSTEHLNQCVYDVSAYVTGIAYSFIQCVVLGVCAFVWQMYRSLTSTTTQNQDGQLPWAIGWGNSILQLLAAAVCNQILSEYSDFLLYLQQNWTGLCLLMFILV